MTFGDGVDERRERGRVRRQECWMIVLNGCEGLCDAIRMGENFLFLGGDKCR
jgi:hypothetical protein